MKPSIKTTIITIILSVTLFIVGFYTWNSFFMLTLPIVGDVKYFETNLGSGFRNSLLFSLTLALIPIATVLIWKIAPVLVTQKKFLTIGIILLVMTLFVVTRREMIKYQARHLQPMNVLDYSDPANPQPKTIESGIPVSTLNFEMFALAGLVTGSIISYFSLRQKTK
jgi:hypothetical protein